MRGDRSRYNQERLYESWLNITRVLGKQFTDFTLMDINLLQTLFYDGEGAYSRVVPLEKMKEFNALLENFAKNQTNESMKLLESTPFFKECRHTYSKHGGRPQDFFFHVMTEKTLIFDFDQPSPTTAQKKRIQRLAPIMSDEEMAFLDIAVPNPQKPEPIVVSITTHSILVKSVESQPAKKQIISLSNEMMTCLSQLETGFKSTLEYYRKRHPDYATSNDAKSRSILALENQINVLLAARKGLEPEQVAVFKNKVAELRGLFKDAIDKSNEKNFLGKMTESKVAKGLKSVSTETVDKIEAESAKLTVPSVGHRK